MLGYVGLCVYFLLFRVQLFSRYGLRRNHGTNLVSIINTSYLFAFFTFPMCYDMFDLFLDVESTAFSEALGGQTFLTLFGLPITNYMPLVVVAVAALTCSNAMPKMLARLGFGLQEATLAKPLDVRKALTHFTQRLVVEEERVLDYFLASNNTELRAVRHELHCFVTDA